MEATMTVVMKNLLAQDYGEHNLIAKDEEPVQDGEGHLGDIGIDDGDAEDEVMGIVIVVMMIQ
jgi:hypothetical protein